MDDILKQFYKESGYAIFLLSPDMKIQEHNPAAATIFGDNLGGHKFTDICPEIQEDKTPSELKMLQMAELSKVNKSLSSEWIFKTAENKLIPTMLILGFAMVGGKESFMALLYDISQRKQAQKAFQDSYNELKEQVKKRTAELLEANNILKQEIADHKKAEENRLKLEKDLEQSRKLESIGTLAAGIAHEINTPVQFISDNTQFLSTAITDMKKIIDNYRKLMLECSPGDKTAAAIKKGLDFEKEIDLEFLEKEIPPAIKQTHDGLERVSKIVSAMRDFSHIGGEDDKTKADINKAIESTITVSRNVWKYCSEIKTDLAKDLPPISCYLSDINQVIMNMIVNSSHAIQDKFQNTTEPKGLIAIKTKQLDSGHVRISVADNGAGIPKEIQEKIFDPFFTTKEVGKGTGQGLSIAYSSIMEKHEGKISLESEVGKGTVFHIDLPIQ